jgi:hypothetical protein
MSAQPHTRGTVEATACPWCKKPNDFRGLDDYGVEPGNILKCDHCTRSFEIVRVQSVKMLWLKPSRG